MSEFTPPPTSALAIECAERSAYPKQRSHRDQECAELSTLSCSLTLLHWRHLVSDRHDLNLSNAADDGS
jgi:hypothetical protein